MSSLVVIVQIIRHSPAAAFDTRSIQLRTCSIVRLRAAGGRRAAMRAEIEYVVVGGARRAAERQLARLPRVSQALSKAARRQLAGGFCLCSSRSSCQLAGRSWNFSANFARVANVILKNSHTKDNNALKLVVTSVTFLLLSTSSSATGQNGRQVGR